MSTPSIRVYDSGPHPHHASHYRQLPHRTAAATPVGIPNARDPPPPPLPPPRHLQDLRDGQDTGWQFFNDPVSPSFAGLSNSSYRSPDPNSSLCQGLQSRSGKLDMNPHQMETTFARRAHPPPMERLDTSVLNRRRDPEQEDMPPKPKLANFSEHQLGQKTLENSSQRYDQDMLSKIGGPSTPSRTLGPPLFSSSQEASQQSRGSIAALKPLQMPSPGSRRPSAPSSGAISPGFTGFRSPLFDNASAPRRFSEQSSNYGDSTPIIRSARGSYDQNFPMDDDESGMKDLNINDRSPGESEDYHTSKSGQKRRASSPPVEAAREDRPAASNGNDLYHRRSAQMLTNRNSPASRFHTNHGSVSSASSFGQRTNSYASSSYGLSVASSATSYTSDRLSPGALSPTADGEYGPVSPYAASRSLNPSPRGSISMTAAAQHQRNVSDHESSQARKMSTEGSQTPRSMPGLVRRAPGVLMCDCCPKKPRKFDTEEKLREHEQEKQYGCQYCHKRFKNKNEAERHQNSLHLRRHSWSCAALTDMSAAFHPSSSHPTTSDVCGYCGEEFSSNPPDWDSRADHLNHIHKFGECNQAKKFFRADHFRQHLKHSHAGTGGKWTNSLENACMRYENPPSPAGVQDSTGQGYAKAGRDQRGSIGGSSSTGPPGAGMKPGVINEAHDES